MRIYGIVGESTQTIVDSDTYQPMPNEVLMQTERPTDGTWVATEDGTWVETLKPSELTMEERIEVIDAQYEQDKVQLFNYYTEAVMREDEELQEEVKAELSALDAQYDIDINNLLEE